MKSESNTLQVNSETSLSSQSLTLVLTTKPQQQRDKTWNKNTKLPIAIKVALVTNRIYAQQLATVRGRSGLAVACLTAVSEVLGSNCAVGSCVYYKNHCDLHLLARAVRTFPAVPSSTQPFTLCGTVNEYQLFGLSNNNKWRWWL